MSLRVCTRENYATPQPTGSLFLGAAPFSASDALSSLLIFVFYRVLFDVSEMYAYFLRFPYLIRHSGLNDDWPRYVGNSMGMLYRFLLLEDRLLSRLRQVSVLADELRAYNVGDA